MNCPICKQFSSVYVTLADGRQLCEACDHFVDAERKRRGNRIADLEQQLEEAEAARVRAETDTHGQRELTLESVRIAAKYLVRAKQAEADLATERERLDYLLEWLIGPIEVWSPLSIGHQDHALTRDERMAKWRAAIDGARKERK